LLAVGNHENSPDYDYADGVTLYMYELGDRAGASTAIPSRPGQGGVTFDAARDGNVIEVRRQGESKPWQVLLINIDTITSIENGTAEPTPRGVLITPDSASDRLIIHLP
jgi:alpha-D-xyloside xylohydrolase